jgi:hypothetical protein
MATTVAPNDLEGLEVQTLSKIVGLDMTTAAVYDVYRPGRQTALLLCAAFTNFSAYPTGTILPSAWGFSWGLNSATTPNDMRASTTIGAGVPAPIIKLQDLLAQPSYITPNSVFRFAVTAVTGATGTCDITFYGGILNK